MRGRDGSRGYQATAPQHCLVTDLCPKPGHESGLLPVGAMRTPSQTQAVEVFSGAGRSMRHTRIEASPRHPYIGRCIQY